MKIFNLLKKLFNVQSVDEISEEMIDNYYNETEKTEEVVENADSEIEEKVEETTEEPKVSEEVVEEKVEEVVENAEPEVIEEKIEEPEEEKKEDEEVLTKEVINSSKGNVPMSKADIMNLHGDQFFSALYKNRKNLM